MMSGLYSELKNYENSDMYRFHMPGHKGYGEREYFGIDITEIDGFDNLHHAEGIIADEMKRAGEYYGSEKTYYLVNGSSCGILSAISAAAFVKKGKILMSRNSHKSAYNAVFLNRLESAYIYPQYIHKMGINGGINPADVDKLIRENVEISCIFITSPTYEGIVSDIKAIADIAHAHKIPLIVDEAHGAHFGIHGSFPVSAIALGADIVIQSVHKTLPSLTQTALLHIGKNSLISRESVEQFLSIYQSSSPSYVLMSAIGNCLDDLISGRADMEIDRYVEALDDFYQFAKGLKKIKVLDERIVKSDSVYDFDRGKIVISTGSSKLSGEELYEILREKYRLQPEMASGNYVICMTSYKDKKEGFDRLKVALAEVDKSVAEGDENEYKVPFFEAKINQTIFEAMNIKSDKYMNVSDAVGKTALTYSYVYPPGIPIIAPGEEVTDEVVMAVKKYKAAGLVIKGEEIKYGD